MRLIDRSFAEPAENLALDEAILDAVERSEATDTLRFWESPVLFVVLGVSQVLRLHVNEPACARDGVGVYRRCSAGGCVLQGPGCLNFSLVLSLDRVPEVRTLHGSYAHILGRVAEALHRHGVAAERKGVSDLALVDQKFSGNAQKRRRNAILHHGTLVYELDANAMERYLCEPDERPDYRGARPHRHFVKCVPLAPTVLKKALCAAFDAPGPAVEPSHVERDMMHHLVRTKYTRQEWTNRR